MQDVRRAAKASAVREMWLAAWELGRRTKAIPLHRVPVSSLRGLRQGTTAHWRLHGHAHADLPLQSLRRT